MHVMTFGYECCGAKYEVPTRLHEDQTMLNNSALVDTMLMFAEATHAAEHPECEPSAWEVVMDDEAENFVVAVGVNDDKTKIGALY